MTQKDFGHDSEKNSVTSQNTGSLDPEHDFPVGGRHCGVSSCNWWLPIKAHIEFIEQDPGVDSWSTFVLDDLKGFTQAGMGRINNSIWTYVWALFGAQVQTKSRIADSFEAQKQFLALLEDAMNSPVDIQAAFTRYESVLQYAESEFNVVFRTGLYMAPSDMFLNIHPCIAGYNNRIIIAPANLPIDAVGGVNSPAVQPQVHGSFHDSKIAGPPQVDPRRFSTVAKPPGSGAVAAAPACSGEAHSKERKTLVVGGVAEGLIALWLALR